MSVYFYKARDVSGNLINDTIEAKSEAEALDYLRFYDLYPYEIKKVSLINKKIYDWGLFKNNVSFADIAFFCSSFSFLLNSGTTINSTFKILQQQIDNKVLCDAVKKVYKEIQKGIPLSKAMSNSPVFPKTLVEVVRVGEKTGEMSQLIKNLSYHYERENKLKDNIKLVLIYPAAVSLLMTVLIVFSMFYVVPRYERMFNSLETNLPLLTKALIAFSSIVRNNFLIIIVLVVVISIGLLNCHKSVKLKRLIDNSLIKAPFIGKSIKFTLNVRFTRLFALLLKSGFTSNEALKLLPESLSNYVATKSIEKIIADMEQGFSLVRAFDSCQLFQPIVKGMVTIGANADILPDTMEKTADFLESQLENNSNKFQKIINISVTLIMGIFVAFLMLALMLPMFDLMRSM